MDCSNRGQEDFHPGGFFISGSVRHVVSSNGVFLLITKASKNCSRLDLRSV
jgi:hypothetical protein